MIDKSLPLSALASSQLSLFVVANPSTRGVAKICEIMDSDEFVPFASNKEKNVDGNTLSSTAISSESLHSLMTDVRAPWMTFSQSDFASDSSSSSLVRLHNEILTFCEYVSPTKVVLDN